MREIAEALAGRLGLTVTSIDAASLGFLGALLSVEQPASSAQTQQLLDWRPTHQGLIADIEAGYDDIRR